MTDWIVVADCFETENRHLYSEHALRQMASLLPGSIVRRDMGDASTESALAVVREAKYEGLQVSVKVEPFEYTREWFSAHEGRTGILAIGCNGIVWHTDSNGTMVIEEIGQPFVAYCREGSTIHSHQ